LKLIAGAANTLRSTPPQAGQIVRVSSLNACTMSKP
jgi:hypothetical protein